MPLLCNGVTLYRFGTLWKNYDIEREDYQQIHIHISAFALVWLGSFVSVPLILNDRKYSQINIKNKANELIFLYTLILLTWFSLEFCHIENDKNHDIIIEHLRIPFNYVKYLVYYITTMFFILNLIYNKETRRNVLSLLHIILQSIYFYFIDKKYVYLLLLTPIALGLIDKFIFKKNTMLAILSSFILFTYNLIFFIYHERQYNHIFVLLVASSLVHIILSKIILYCYYNENSTV